MTTRHATDVEYLERLLAKHITTLGNARPSTRIVNLTLNRLHNIAILSTNPHRSCPTISLPRSTRENTVHVQLAESRLTLMFNGNSWDGGVAAQKLIAPGIVLD